MTNEQMCLQRILLLQTLRGMAHWPACQAGKLAPHNMQACSPCKAPSWTVTLCQTSLRLARRASAYEAGKQAPSQHASLP